jgi:hypothetical protein
MVSGIVLALGPTAPDLVIWLIATALLLAAVLMPWVNKRSQHEPPSAWPPSLFSQIIVRGEALFCARFLIDVLKHLHSL